MLVLQVHIDRLLKGMAEARNLMCGKAQEGEFFMQGKDFNERGMSFDGFCTCVRMDIQKRLGDGYSVKEESVIKNNDIRMKGISITEQGMNISPNIYLEGYYEAYRAGSSLREIEDCVLRCYRENKAEVRFDADLFMDWKRIREKVIYKLVNYDRNRELLKDVPHRQFLDLAIVYECFLGADSNSGATILIHDSHLELWGVTADELHETACRNTPELMGSTFDSMDKVMLEIMGCGGAELDGIEGLPSREELEKDISVLHVLTNRYKLHGAGCILYENILKGISEKWGCDIIILPSSIHETILVPEDGTRRCDELAQIVSEINRTQVSPDEVLSDNVYQYVRETGEIIMQEGEKV